MGSSHVEYRGRGFWARDTDLELWLLLLADEAESTPNPIPRWLEELRQHWLEQAVAGGSGCLDTGLERLAGAAERERVVADCARRALLRISRPQDLWPDELLGLVDEIARGSIDRRDLRRRLAGPWDSATRESIAEVDEALLALVRGEWREHDIWADDDPPELSRSRRMPLPVFTLGHSTRGLEDFLALLAEHGVEVLADVRRYPGSRRFPHFRRETLAAALAAAGIAYHHLPGLGGHRKPRTDSPHTHWTSAGFRAYADHTETAEFQEAFGWPVIGRPP